MRLGGQQHHVLWPGLSHVLHGAHAARMLLAAIWQYQPEPTRVDRFKILVAGDERYVLASQRELRPQVAADCTSANDRVPHDLKLPSHVGAEAQADALRQADALKLASSAFGQLVDKQYLLGYFVGRHALGDELL